MLNTKEFLETIHGNEQIWFRAIKNGATAINEQGYYNNHIENTLRQLNEQNFEIYFVVNSGGTRANDINKINAVFIDLDRGDENLEEYKDRKMKEINQFPCEPSFIVETRNGFHVYWLVKNDTTKAQFEECEKRLISYFKADEKVKDLSRILRLPDYYWCKDINNKFLVQIIHHNNIRYNVNELINGLPLVIKDKSPHNKNYNNNLSSYNMELYP